MGIESLKVGKRVQVGTVIGQDPYGNTYYEIPAQPQLGKRRPTRWYNTVDTNKKDIIDRDRVAGFDAELPSEWESWLRHRRAEPPTEHEVMPGEHEFENKDKWEKFKNPYSKHQKGK